MTLNQEAYRILCVGETWFGSDARACFAAFRRLGHSVQVLDENNYVSTHWLSTISKSVRKLFRSVFVNELSLAVANSASNFKPDCLFVFKGNWVHPKVISSFRKANIPTVNFYPDVSFLSHGPYIPKALPLYDHVFTTKSYGVTDMKQKLGVSKITFLPPGFDPELHRPIELTEDERRIYDCDVGFIGTWSRKKEHILRSLMNKVPGITLRVWGEQWDRSTSPQLKNSLMGAGVIGDEYTKAICGSRICLGLLSEQGKGASSGDLITARTFQIPACATFMLHERNEEVCDYFQEGKDAAFFEGPDELAEKVRYYLAHENEREEIARSGRNRSVNDDYSMDGRMKVIVQWLRTTQKACDALTPT